MVSFIFSGGVLASFLERENNTSLGRVSPDRLPLSGSSCLTAWTNDKINFSHSDYLCSVSLNAVELNSKDIFVPSGPVWP